MAKKRKKIFLKFYNVAFRDMAKNEKNIFENWQHSIVRHLKRCIRAYSEPFIFTSSRDMAKNKKIFLKFCNHCAQLKIDAYEPIPSLLFSPEAEIWPKNEIKYF
ncbi:hypothetical protein PUN28_020894 [Cardiocondyla obscurior]|uniref:Uncharacterized protein n=1 Tax=Cardiocondyla obscurior TaxID=286306 RepID=A0AAW2E9F8_9HYME